MADTMKHRGPDGAGVVSLPSVDGSIPVTFGHRRLSIIDPVERSNQPMWSFDDRYVISYNGEIYNYLELRAELAQRGYQFRTQSDTEVVLAAYALDGQAMLTRLNGIFAFAIWDTQAQVLFVARDRLGVKPLYYMRSGPHLLFASETKAILRVVPTPPLSPEAIAQYLTFLWVPDPDTLFQGIHQLPAGHYGVWRDQHLTVTQWWDVMFSPEEQPEQVWPKELREVVQRATRRQMVSDVPLGAFLSGGIDSSAIVAEMSATAGPVTTYTVGFNERDLAHEIVPDDIKYAREIGRQFQTNYNEQILEAEVTELLPQLVWNMDQPIADPACITTYLICRAAREQLTVILSGMGGDEVFAGYPRHLAALWGRRADAAPRRARAAVRRLADGRLTMGPPGRLRGPRRNAMKFLRGIDGSPNDRYLTYCSYYSRSELLTLFAPELRAELREFDPMHRHRDHFAKVQGEHWLNQLLYVDMKMFLPCLNLAYTDRMSMAASTEVRVPLLDNEVVERANALPPRLKLHGTTRKYAFKRSMEGVLPESVIWRPKAGFSAPVRSWVTGELSNMFAETLAPANVARRGLFDSHEVDRIVSANRAGSEDNALRLWALLTLELWQQAFVDRAPPSSDFALVS